MLFLLKKENRLEEGNWLVERVHVLLPLPRAAWQLRGQKPLAPRTRTASTPAASAAFTMLDSSPWLLQHNHAQNQTTHNFKQLPRATWGMWVPARMRARRLCLFGKIACVELGTWQRQKLKASHPLFWSCSESRPPPPAQAISQQGCILFDPQGYRESPFTCHPCLLSRYNCIVQKAWELEGRAGGVFQDVGLAGFPHELSAGPPRL